MRPDRVIMRHEGRKLRLSETAEEQGLADLGVVEVQTDFSKKVQDLQRELGLSGLALETMLHSKKKAKERAELQSSICLKTLESCKKEKKTIDREVRETEAAKVF